MARQGFKSQHWSDGEGRPAGGVTQGVGFVISWQNGPLGTCTCVRGTLEIRAEVHDLGCERKEPNGAFVEDVIGAALDRLRYYQTTEFADGYNRQALDKLAEAQQFLRERTRAREAAGVEGTHRSLAAS